MKKPSYTKEMRDRALREGKGLVTIAVMYPHSKRPGKFGSYAAFQGPSTREECKRVFDFILQMATERNAHESPPDPLTRKAS